MKPRELYSGQAPAAISMMGQGLMEAGANIGRSTMAGYQALGQGLASGVEQAANAYQEKKKLDAQNKADEGFVKTMLPYLPESVRNDFAARHEDIISDPSASALDKAAFYHTAKSYLGQSIAHSMDLEKIREQAAYNPAWLTAPSAVAASQAETELKKTQIEAMKNAPAIQATKDAQAAAFSKQLGDVLRGAPTTPSVATAPISGAASPTLYESLTPDIQAMVDSSGLGRDAWNSLDESQREANLANKNIPNFGLPPFKSKKR